MRKYCLKKFSERRSEIANQNNLRVMCTVYNQSEFDIDNSSPACPSGKVDELKASAVDWHFERHRD